MHESHSLRVTGSLIWCNHWGCYGQERIKALKVQCKGSQVAGSKAGQLAQLRKGRHPLTGEQLGKSIVLRPATPGRPAAPGRAGSGTLHTALPVPAAAACKDSRGDLGKFPEKRPPP